STKRGESVDEKIRKLDAALTRYKEQIKRTRPGPAREAIKARALRALKQKRMFKLFCLVVLQGAGFKTVQQKLYVPTDRNMLPSSLEEGMRMQ
ncbi:hypothetical protein CRG98_031150, partial [Punica granatum]